MLGCIYSESYMALVQSNSLKVARLSVYFNNIIFPGGASDGPVCSRCELELFFHLAWLNVPGKDYLFPKRDLISFVSKSISVLSALFQLGFFCVSGRYFTCLSVYLIRAGIGRKGAHVGSLPLSGTVLWINSDSCRAICLCCTLLSLFFLSLSLCLSLWKIRQALQKATQLAVWFRRSDSIRG